ncbi:MAG: BTAD domain-containing putative transcriptional regulator [Acidimicrobiia bacterium]
MGRQVEIRLLGAPEVLAAGIVVEVGSAKQRALLTALALEPGAVVSSERLVDALWGEEPPESAAGTLRSLVYRLRKTLSDAGEEGEPLRGKGSGYVLDVDPDAVDAARFERLAAAGRDALATGDARLAADSLRTGLDLWRGPALGEVASWPAFTATARRLDEARLAATEDLAEAELVLHRPGDALARLEAHVAAHPLRERAWGQLMLAHYRLGRQADALRAYQDVRAVLGEELGIEPTPALRELEAAILQQRPELMPPPVPSVRQRDLGDTVAFLFTDIAGSTRRWEGDQETMAADLARHDKLLTEACEDWGGRVFSHTGDGLCAAFPTAAAAIGAAVAGQVALAAEQWGAEANSEPLRVRMGVHAGAAERRAGNYFGPTLNRTARLMASASGGQVVCSGAAADLAFDHLPEPVTLLDLGEHRLADLGRPERIFQVAHPGLQADFAPLRTAAIRHNLPAALTSFVGRADETSRVAELLGASRLVTLAGPGGAGKTRLALAVAGAVMDRFPDGVWFVALAAVRDPTLVGQVVADVLGFDPRALEADGRRFDEALCDQLRHRRLLVVLDNWEHVVDRAADLAHAVVAGCPDVAILATSREVLGVPGETPVRVGPLTLPGTDAPDELAASDAVALFCARAAESVDGFALTEANAPAVARICRRLDGIPLALELAAARVRVLGARRLADRLDDCLGLLTGGPRTAEARHRTLQAAIDWSHDLLSDDERVVLRRLAVFPSDFSLEAAEAVTEGGGDLPPVAGVFELIGRLADKSLLVPSRDDDDAVRYRLLETVREYAAGKLEAAAETAALRERHRDFFTLDVDWFYEFTDLHWLRWMEVEDDNVRAALQWSWEQHDRASLLRLVTGQCVYWFFAGAVDGVEWLERAVAVPGPGDVSLRAFARVALTYWLVAVGGDEGMRRCPGIMEEALRLADEEGNAVDQGWMRAYLAQVAIAQGRLDDADAFLAEMEVRVPAAACRLLDAVGQLFLAGVATARGALDLARERGERALAILDEVPETYFMTMLRSELVLVETAAGRFDAAQRHAAEAVRTARATPGQRRALVGALCRAAELAMMAGHIETARDLLDELLGLLRDLGGRGWAAEALELTAIVVGPDRPETASVLLGAAAGLRRALGQEAGTLPVMADRLATCREHVAGVLGAAAGGHEARGAAMHPTEVLAFARAQVQTRGGPE